MTLENSRSFNSATHEKNCAAIAAQFKELLKNKEKMLEIFGKDSERIKEILETLRGSGKEDVACEVFEAWYSDGLNI